MSTIAIIGSGIGGLVSGNLLAQRGHKVTLFESHDRPGGYTSGFWRKGFYFESGTLSFESSDLVFKVMKDLGVFDRIPFTRQYGRWVYGDLDCEAYSLGDLKKALFETYPLEKENLSAYFAEVDGMARAMFSLRRPGNVLQALAMPFKLAKLMRLFKKYRLKTVSEFTASYFSENSPLYRLLKLIAYPDMGAVLVGGAFATFLEDYWTVRTGMQSWADALAENFKSLGGELRLKSPVDGIVTREGRTTGVRSRGEVLAADYVISACDYKKTFLSLLDDRSLIPAQLLEKIGSAQVSEAFTTVYLGLNLPREKMKEHLKIPHVFFGDDNPEAGIYDSADADFFSKTWIMLYSPSLMNAELAPEGKSSLMIQTMTPHRWMNNWGGGDRETYKQLKSKAKDALIARASALIPALAEHIEFVDAATPLTYERYTRNTDGASSAWSWNPNKRFYEQPMGARIETPVRNLYVGSCWANQIGGVPGAINAALQCAKKIK
jgi:phytoene dehydrogenase-like protein